MSLHEKHLREAVWLLLKEPTDLLRNLKNAKSKTLTDLLKSYVDVD